MLKVTISEAIFESPEFPNFKVSLSRFDNPEQATLEFLNKSAGRRYTLNYSRFKSVCELIFLSKQLLETVTLPSNTEVKQLINKQGNDVGVIIDIVAKTISIGFISSNGKEDSASVADIPFSLLNLLNKTIDKEILLPSELSSDD